MYVLLELRPCRPDLATTLTSEEQAIVSAHFAGLQTLCKAGNLLIAGRSEDAAVGIAVLDVPDMAAAQRVVDEDPALQRGIMIPTLRPFLLALYAPRDGTEGKAEGP